MCFRSAMENFVFERKNGMANKLNENVEQKTENMQRERESRPSATLNENGKSIRCAKTEGILWLRPFTESIERKNLKIVDFALASAVRYYFFE